MQELYIHQLNLIKAIQIFRCPFLDNFFLILNLFDTLYFPFVLIPIIWMGYNWKWGARILYILIVNSILNHFFKSLFMQPRPLQLDPSVGILNLTSYGFPSGAAQSSILYSGIVIKYFKNKKWAWIISINLVFWIGLSRMYLGIHFLTDILGGYVIGFIVLAIFFYLFPKIELR